MFKDFMIVQRYDDSQYNTCDELTLDDDYQTLRQFVESKYHEDGCISVDIFSKEGDGWSLLVSSSRLIEVQFHY